MKVVGEGILPAPVRSFAWSPTVDLCVFLTAKEVSAHRLTGQKVWSINCNGLHSPDLEFTHITWRNDGKAIATGLDDGSVYVWDVEDARKTHQVMLNSLPQGPISCLNWIGEDLEVGMNSREWATGNRSQTEDLDVDFEVERYLPRVKAIARNNEVVSSHTISAHSGDSGKPQAVDMVLIGSETGQVELSVFGTFALAAMNTNYAHDHKLITPIHHCTTADLALHALIGRSSTSTNLYLNFFFNRTLLSHGKTLRQLTASSTNINALLEYLSETWTSISEEWSVVENVREDAYSKLVQYLDEEPESKPSWWSSDYKSDPEGALLCLLMTGVSEPAVIKWFTEKFIFVQNTKKWEKRILDGYDAIRTLIHEHILPVGERIIIVLSRLRGLSVWSNKSQRLPLDENTIAEALDIIDVLFARSHEILRQITIERSSFETFSSWLILMAEDVLAHEDANAENPPLHTIDTVKVAEYISEYLPHPIVAKFAADMNLDVPKGEGRYDGYMVLIRRLMDKLKSFFRRAAGELREGVDWTLPAWIDLQLHDEIASSDARIVVEEGSKTLLYIAVALPKQCEVRIYRYQIQYDGKESPKELEMIEPEVGKFTIIAGAAEKTIRDVMFLDDDSLIVVGTSEGNFRETGFVIKALIDHDLNYVPIERMETENVNMEVSDEMEVVTEEGEQKWLPVKCTCNGSEMRRIICIIDKDGQRFKMLDVDYSGGDDDEET